MYSPRTQIWHECWRVANNIAMLFALYEVHAQSYYAVLIPNSITNNLGLWDGGRGLFAGITCPWAD
jgi:hypothetical protein